jgi:hypothetical protein
MHLVCQVLPDIFLRRELGDSLNQHPAMSLCWLLNGDFTIKSDLFLFTIDKVHVFWFVWVKTGALASADGLVSVVPSPTAMRRMLSVCDQFAEECNIVFNASVVNLSVFSLEAEKRVTLHGSQLLPIRDSFTNRHSSLLRCLIWVLSALRTLTMMLVLVDVLRS